MKHFDSNFYQTMFMVYETFIESDMKHTDKDDIADDTIEKLICMYVGDLTEEEQNEIMQEVPLAQENGITGWIMMTMSLYKPAILEKISSKKP